MNRSFFIGYICVLWVLSVPAVAGESWFVSPTGNDEANGSIDAPFATVPRAQKAASPGDTVYLRGGTYRLTETQSPRRRGLFARLIELDKDGTPDKPITYRAYLDETPVFDCSEAKPLRQRVTAFYVSGS